MCHCLATNKVIFAYMKPFLQQVAQCYYTYKDISRCCFVFPNRRSMLFFRKYLAEAVSDAASHSPAGEVKPLLMPEMMTINDLFYRASSLKAADRVRLLIELYDCYKDLNPKAEPLDEFMFWGDVILGDFNDLDKYLVDPRQLFANVSDYKNLQDTFSYLTETQRKAIEGFVSHFNDVSGKLTVDIGSDNVKGRFLQIWNILYRLYIRYNEALDAKGMAYEGMVYRRLAMRLKQESASEVLGAASLRSDCYVFVGLNALNECEKTLLGKLRDASMAEFCWDWSGDMIRHPQNRSSFFMAENVKAFPQACQWDEEGVTVPKINVLSVSSSVGQAKRLPDILKHEAVNDGGDCAVVLPDENLLVPVLNSIPDHISDINVTMGLPMSGSQIYALMNDVASMQLHSVCRNGKWYFYHKQVWDIFSDEVFVRSADETVMSVVEKVRTEAKYYIPQEDLCGVPLLDVVFRPVVMDTKTASKDQIYAFAEYQKEVLTHIAGRLSGNMVLALELEYAKEYHKSINQLQEIGLEILPVTYVRLLSQLLGGISVPFRGEPLKGLQIMGPLETRALDFRNLIILSANEGVFPRRSVSSSFIPPELRKGFGMPTYEYQDAVWAYYFYRMISRAESVWMLVDSRTEGLKSGEESRYIKQLEYHFGVPVNRYVVKFGLMKTAELSLMEKTEDDVKKIRDTVLSATALQTYLACPAKFYYSVVKGLRPEDEVAESLDYGMFGTVYHDTMRALYTHEYAMKEDFFFNEEEHDGGLGAESLGKISREYIKGWLGRKEEIKGKIRSLIVRQLNVMELSGRNLVVADVILRYVVKTLERDLELLEQSGKDSFDILGRELKVYGQFHGQRFKGFIDRIDSFAPEQARVVDYKTGKVLKDDEDIHDGNAEAIADKIFAQDVKDRPKIALQFFMYDMLVQSRPELEGRNISNCVYSTSRLFKEAPINVPMNKAFYDAVSDRLKVLLDEMCDVSVPFRRTEDSNVCKYCDFNKICLKS